MAFTGRPGNRTGNLFDQTRLGSIPDLSSDVVEGDLDWLVVGRIGGVYGVRGWVKVFSYTQPQGNLLDYRPWYLDINGAWQCYPEVEARAHGKGLIAAFEGWRDRERSRALNGVDIAIRREQLPAIDEDDYYWAELVGMQVVNGDGVALGRVQRLLETGANDVLVVKGDRERLIPFVMDVFGTGCR